MTDQPQAGLGSRSADDLRDMLRPFVERTFIGGEWPLRAMVDELGADIQACIDGQVMTARGQENAYAQGLVEIAQSSVAAGTGMGDPLATVHGWLEQRAEELANGTYDRAATEAAS